MQNVSLDRLRQVANLAVSARITGEIGSRKTTLLQVQEGLAAVVDGGTGKNARLRNISVAG